MTLDQSFTPTRGGVVQSLQTARTIAAILSVIGGCAWAIGCGDSGTETPTNPGGDSGANNTNKGGAADSKAGAAGVDHNAARGGSSGTGGGTNTAGVGGHDATANLGGNGNGGGLSGRGGNRPGGDTDADVNHGGTGGKGIPTGGSGGRARDGGAVGAGGSGTGGAQTVDGSAGPPGVLKKYFGNIDTRGSIRSDFKTMWDQFSPENAGKWGEVEKSDGSYNWKTLDAMYKYTQDNGIIFKEHCFCWGAQQPGWVKDSNGEAAVKAWMKAFCDRYPATAMIDVFNESLHNSPAYKNGIGGTGSSGYDWLVNAFKWAREACPKAILLYNDYNTIEYSNENNGVIKLVKAIKAAGAPIDGVGCQAHDVAKVSAKTVTTYVQNIIDQTGVPVYITEIDIGVADDSQQQQIMKDIVTPLWANDNVKGFTYWGYIEGATWRSNTGLMSDSGTKRPALTWLMDFLKR